MNILGPVAMLGLVLLGISLLWSLRLAYGDRRVVVDDALRLVLTISAWILIYLGLLGVVAQAMMVVPNVGFSLGGGIVAVSLLSMIALAGVLVVFGTTVARFRALEWQSLMTLLAAAAQKGIPLHEAADAFARERTDEVGLRAARLASGLRSGMPLPEALDRSSTTLPLDGLLAARYGTETDDLRGAVAAIVARQGSLDILIRGAAEKCFYLSIVIWIVLLQLTFMWLKIVPVFAQMFLEFDLELPGPTRGLMQVTDVLLRHWLVSIALLVGFLAFVVVSFYGMLFYLGWLPADAPLVHRLTRRYDSSLVLRGLSAAVAQQRPLQRAVWMLGRLYPRRRVRRRLQAAGERINNGEHWCESLRSAGLLRRQEGAVLQAAERVGNLQWALNEMADSTLRRLAYRLRLAVNLMFPAVLLGMGMLIAFLVISLFVPLISLILGLT